jgi:tetratricopeptide (TPR) repeat protein
MKVRNDIGVAGVYFGAVIRFLLATSLLALPALTSAQAVPADEAAVEAGRAAAEERARQRFEDGRLAFAEGRNEVALAAFLESYELSGRPELLYNIGLVHDRLRHDREALEAFRQFLVEVPGTENRVQVESRIRVLEEEVAREEALAAAAANPTGPVDGGEEVWQSPIFWTLLGVGVVAVGVGVGLGVYYSSDPGTAPVMPGPSGVVIEALRF